MEKRTILIAEDDADLAHFLALQCRQLGFDVFRSPDAMHALMGVHRLKPSLLVLDLNMPGGNGLSVCEMLASDRTIARIPVIIMSGQCDKDTVDRCKLAGAQFVPKGPKLWAELAAAIGRCLSSDSHTTRVDDPQSPVGIQHGQQPVGSEKEGPDSRPRIMSIDDDPDFSKALKLRLEPYGVEVFRTFSGMQGFWTCLDIRPEVIILDLKMSDGDGSYVMQRLQSHSLTQKTPVIILTGQKNPALRRQLLSQGAVAYLNKPLVMDELLAHLLPFVPLQAVAAVDP